MLHVHDFEIHDNEVTLSHKNAIDAKVRCKDGSIYSNLVGPRHEDSKFTNISGNALYIDGGDSPVGTMGDIDVFGNVVFGDEGPGIGVGCEGGGEIDGLDIFNNVVDVSCNCFAINPIGNGDKKNVRVYNNTFAQRATPAGLNHQFVVNVNEGDLSSIPSFEFKNNIVARQVNKPLDLFRLGGPQLPAITVSIDTNLFWNETTGSTNTQGTNAEVDDPEFVNQTFTIAGQSHTSGFSIESGTPAHDAGLNSLGIGDDITGFLRYDGSAVDLGAFEVDE